MNITPKMQTYLDKCPSFTEHFAECFKDNEYRQAWLEMTLTDFVNTGNVDDFINGLIEVVKHCDNNSMNAIAKRAGLNRSNLYSIVKGEVKPRIDTIFKLVKGLGYDFEIKIKSA